MSWRTVIVAGFTAWLSLGLAIGAVLSPGADRGAAPPARAALADASR